MKTKFYFLVISLLAICSVCLPACDNDEKGDVTKPVIDLIEPEEGADRKSTRLNSSHNNQYRMPSSA